ncbi:GAF domain-containing protein [Lapidilactobacillus gannanensis]|uniref:GAF domain-containing protein n=1 Tax=Lapidilactobacillus gannanensis TaxID=2486002 RepID=A0ABW4BMK0_9LACO|nr:GAF domain-containing protein [Lapidilactobacillus gannanensis]
MSLLVAQYQSLFADPEYQSASQTAILANTSAFLKEMLTDINWVGFYLWQSDRQQLEVGPFQGKIACSTIASGSGVCGTAFHQQKVQIVPDVHQFAGHIACDSATNSEIVIPLTDETGQKIGVLDIDSPIKNRFQDDDATELVALGQALVKLLAD